MHRTCCRSRSQCGGLGSRTVGVTVFPARASQRSVRLPEREQRVLAIIAVSWLMAGVALRRVVFVVLAAFPAAVLSVVAVRNAPVPRPWYSPGPH